MSRFLEYLYLDDLTVDRLLLNLSETSESQAVERTSTPGSGERSFAELWREIANDEEEILLEDGDDINQLWESANEGQFCKFTGKLSVPSIVALVSAAEELRNFVQLGQQLGFVPISGNMDEQLSQMAAVKDIIRDTFPVVLHAEQSNLPIVLPLDTNHSRVKVDRYSGKATVFGRIIERVDPEEKKDIVQIPGTAHIAQMSRQQRRASARQGQPEQADDMTLTGPALTLRVLAVQQ